MSKVIFLDAGHGGNDPGAVNGSRYESNDNLRMALAVQKLLTAQGQTVVMSRTTDATVSLSARTTAANNAKADIFVSLHRNSFTNTTANGVETWVYTTAGSVDVAAATEVQERLAAVGVQSNRGVKKGAYYVCGMSNMTAMLVELGFISNAKDNTLFDTNFDAYAKAIAQGICAALGIAWTEAGAVEDTGPLYRIQVGAFRSKENAENFLKTVQAMNLEAFMVTVDTPTGTE